MNDREAEVQQKVEACEDALRKLCELRGVSLVSARYAGKSILAVLKGASQNWELDVDCLTQSNASLPKVDLVNTTVPLAHVAQYGNVCFNDNQGLSIDKGRHADLVAHAVMEAYELLERSVLDFCSGKHEFYNELEGYWGGFHGPVCWSYVALDDQSRFIEAYVPHKSGDDRPIVIANKKDKLPPEFDMKGRNRARGLYLVLDAYVPVPFPRKRPDAAYVSSVLSSLTGRNKSLWDTHLGTLSTKRLHAVHLFLAVPRSAGGVSLVGLQFHLKNRQVDVSSPIKLLGVARHTAAYMRERGGANSNLAKMHVAVLGCGSVGSEIADALASSGVGKLTLVDPDTFSIDNVFRHALGRDSVGSTKVLALRRELERKYPGVVIAARHDFASAWLRTADSQNVDAIVVAIGQPSLERDIHTSIRSQNRPIPVVFTWLDPLDLGGHAVLVQPGQKGCLECLYQDAEGAASLEPRITFLAPNQKVTKTLTGCASFYVPYGAIQSRKTALLAVEQILEGLLNSARPAYAFWRGAGTIAVSNPLVPSAWWERAKNQESPTDLPFRDGCRTCRGGE